MTGIDPYITATVREVRDSAGEAPEGGEEESNDVVSSDVRFSSEKMARACIGVGGGGVVGGVVGSILELEANDLQEDLVVSRSELDQ